MVECIRDLLFVNASTIFVDGKLMPDLYVAVSDDRITRVGAGSEWRLLATKSCKVIDCQGGTLLPGFVDAHCHPLAIAMMHGYIDCRAQQVTSLKTLKSAVAALATRDGWIRVANYPGESLRNECLDCHSLDGITHAPLLLIDDTGQFCIMNSEALRRSAINEVTVAENSEESLNQRGIFTGNDRRVGDCVPPLNEADIEAGVKALNRKLLSLGITCVHDTSWTNGLDNWRRYSAYKQAGMLTPRIRMMAGAQLLEEFAAEQLCTGYGDDGLRLGAAKIAVDELLGDEQPDQTIIEHFVRKAIKYRFQLSLHAGNSYLLEAALNALVNARKDNSERRRPVRFEHCPFCPPRLWSRLKEESGALVLQPALFHQFSVPESDLVRQGVEQSWYPVKSLLNEGIAVAFSSDAPLGELNPLFGIYAACTRNTLNEGVVGQREGIGLERAIDLYTRAGAGLDLNSGSIGRIAPGLKADLVLFDRDFRAIDAGQLLHAKVTATWVDGQPARF